MHLRIGIGSFIMYEDIFESICNEAEERDLREFLANRQKLIAIQYSAYDVFVFLRYSPGASPNFFLNCFPM